MRKALLIGVVLAFAMTGCKKQVPNDIIQSTLRTSLSTHTPKTTSAMCGVPVRGLSTAIITVTKKNPDNTGIAHVRGTPWLATGTPPYCEGDVQFKYSSTAKTTGYKRKTTTTTWWLDEVVLVGIQTPGVQNRSINENPDGED